MSRITRLAAFACVLGALAPAAPAQCPDLAQPHLVGVSIYHVTGGDLLTVINPPFADGSLVGAWLKVIPDEEEPARYFRIVSNQHFQQNDTSVFTVAEDLEHVGGSSWWLHSGQDELSIFANLACPPGQAPRPGLAELDVNGATNPTGERVSSGAVGPYFTLAIAGRIMAMSIRGEAVTMPPVILLAGPLDVGHRVVPQGQIDLFLPQTIVAANGLLPDPVNSQFVLPASGILNLVVDIPAALSGLAVGLQSVSFVSGPDVVAISNAVEVTFL